MRNKFTFEFSPDGKTCTLTTENADRKTRRYTVEFRKVETGGAPVIVTDHGEPKLEIRRYQPRERAPLDILRGSVLRYDAPTEPVADGDWDALR